jgi:hypothetical protein
MVLDLARRLKEHPPRRSVLLMHFSGEELGLLGSAYWAKHPTVPAKSVKFFFCFDMVGRLDSQKRKLFIGVMGAPRLSVDRIDGFMPASLHVEHEMGMLLGASDHASLARIRIPSVFFTTGLHDDYHRPADTAERINYEGEALIEDAALAAVCDMANAEATPNFDEESAWILFPQPRTPLHVDFGAFAAKQMDPRGLLLGGCRAGSPAAHSGLRVGDVLVKFGTLSIHSLQDLEVAVKARKLGESVPLQWIRDGRLQDSKAVMSGAP